MTPANDMRSAPAAHRARLVAFHLPQFHPIPENDAWWGKGFTEWTNVARARPQFAGHYQPHLPADLGFYDLRLPETRAAQAELAQAYGLEGFCYYHYWFAGRRLLERPVNDLLARGEPDFPFCLCWANESWSRRWLGEARDILIAQTYSPEDDLAHIRWLIRAFADPRYIRVGGRPLFLVYRPADLPDPQRTIDLWRSECVREGLPEPYLLATNSHCSEKDCRQWGFDATLAFKPELGVLPRFLDDGPRWDKLRRNLKLGVLSATLKVYDYGRAQRAMMALRRPHPMIPGVLVRWDNTPRRGRQAIILARSDPAVFERVLNDAIELVRERPADERLVMVNAWNEWAEGNHLEPDQLYGRKFLDAVKRANHAPQPTP
jgi:lipopolysaccharide biosynthesis protein